MNRRLIIVLGVAILMGIYAGFSEKPTKETPNEVKEKTIGKTEKATFAGGCFWCMQPPFDKLNGVLSTRVGYTGGPEKKPTYKEVAYGKTRHAEAIEIIFDPSTISYAALLDLFWRNIDPTQVNGQFADKGSQYRTEIFYHNDTQKRVAELSRDELGQSGRFKKPIVTKITAASAFYPAEDYHQKYYQKNPVRYKRYRIGSGREGFLRKTWGTESSPSK